MWSRSLVALPVGLLLSVSLVLNLNFLLPSAVDVRLLIGLLIAFALWAGAMVFFYRQASAWRAARPVLLLLAASAAINAVFMI